MATVHMNLVLPTTETIGPQYVTLNTNAFTAIDEHDHTTGRGKLLPTAALNINADLSLNGRRLTEALGLRLLQRTGPLVDPVDVATLYSVQGDLYYNNEDGFAVQVTSGNSINAASVAGIGGDYSGSAAQLSYNDTTKTYLFTSAPGIRAGIEAGGLNLSSPNQARIIMANTVSPVRTHVLEAAAYGWSLTDATASRLVLDYVAGATGETDRLELMPANTAPVVIGSTLLHRADARAPLQLSTAGASTESYVGINKNGQPGLLIGYVNATTGAGGTVAATGGMLRMLNTDKLNVVCDNVIAAQFSRASVDSFVKTNIYNILTAQSIESAGRVLAGSVEAVSVKALTAESFLTGPDDAKFYTAPFEIKLEYASDIDILLNINNGAWVTAVGYNDDQYKAVIPLRMPASGVLKEIKIDRGAYYANITYTVKKLGPGMAYQFDPVDEEPGIKQPVTVVGPITKSASPGGNNVVDVITLPAGTEVIDGQNIYFINMNVAFTAGASFFSIFNIETTVTMSRLKAGVR